MNEELIERLRHDSAFLAQHGYKRFSGNIAAAIAALEAAEAKLAKTAGALTIERKGFNERLAAIEAAHRILGAAISDGIHPELAEDRALAAEAERDRAFRWPTC